MSFCSATRTNKNLYLFFVKIEQIANIIEGEIVCANGAGDSNVNLACASDLMSDVLTLSTDGLLLITGLTNVQTIRTAEMADIKAILFVRSKKPTPQMIELAQEEGMYLITTKKSMFNACALLYNAGLRPVY